MQNPNKSLKIIFAGTPTFAVPSLQNLIESPHKICAVYTQPDRPAGRGRKLLKSPIKQLAEKQGLPIEQPTSLRSPEACQTLAQYKPDLMVVVAYGLLLPSEILNIPKFGCVNVHASLLPHWRGAAPIQRAILSGDKLTGVTIMQMDVGLDTGPMLSKATYDIASKDTTQTLHEKLAALGAKELIKVLDKILQNQVVPELQDEAQASYAKKISKQEALIDWKKPAIEIERMLRAFNPWPVAFSYLNNQTIRIWDAEVFADLNRHEIGTIIKLNQNGIYVATGKDLLKITKLQFPGGRVVDVKNVLNARRDFFQVGTRFGFQ